jgi:hypothetical protein
VAPEAFEPDRVRNLWDQQWRLAGTPTQATSPVDGSPIMGPPMLQLGQGLEAVAAAAAEHDFAGVVRVDRGAVTERKVEEAARTGARLVLGPKAVLTPLAREKARAKGIAIERES